MSARTIQTDEIKGLTGGILVRNKASYAEIPSTDSLVGADIPSWQNILEVASGVTQAAIARAIFTDETDISIINYQGAYAAIYGNAPILDIYIKNEDGSYTQDRGTPATVTYVDGVIDNGIDTINYTYPVTTSGYILICGTPDSTVEELPIEII